MSGPSWRGHHRLGGDTVARGDTLEQAVVDHARGQAQHERARLQVRRAGLRRRCAAETAASTRGEVESGALIAVSTLRLSTIGRRMSAAMAPSTADTGKKPCSSIVWRAAAPPAPSSGR